MMKIPTIFTTTFASGFASTFATLLAIAAVTLSSPVWAQSPSRPPVSWGAASNGLRLGVSAFAASRPESPEVFEVSFKNDGTDDFVLHLGFMLANGKVMFPDAVRVMLTGPSNSACELRYFDRRYGVVAGRIDDFTVPLPRGATYILQLPVDRLWCPEPMELPMRLAPGTYRVTARFEGRRATGDNLDMRGVTLLNFWTGTTESGSTTFEVSQR
jgi:hypothetical protein